MGTVTSTPRKAPLPRLADFPKFVEAAAELAAGSHHFADPARYKFSGTGAPPLKYPLLAYAVKKGDKVQYIERVEDPREAIVREFNQKNRRRGIHAVPIFEADVKRIWEVAVAGRVVFRSFDRRLADSDYNRRAKCQKVEGVTIGCRMGVATDELKRFGWDAGDDADQEGGAA